MLSYIDRMSLAFEDELKKIAATISPNAVRIGKKILRKSIVPAGAILGYKTTENAFNDWRTGRQYRKSYNK